MTSNSNQTTASASHSQNAVMCNNNLYNCSQTCVEGYRYCIEHITDDRNAPYRPCTFVFSNGKKCVNNVLKGERRDGLCSDHAKRSALCKIKSLRKRQPPESIQTLIDELQHYQPGKDDEPAADKPYGPTNHKLHDYASESDSEAEIPTAEQTVRQEDDSDAESIDSDQDDPLRHAGVYTPEEVVMQTRDKLIKLQALYVDQFKRLHHQLKEARRRYLHGSKKEKENGVSSAPYPDTPSERRAVAKLRSLRRFQRHRGTEALLHHQLQEKRLQVTQGVNYKAPPAPKCTFVDVGIKCLNSALPLTKHCSRHVLSDSSQMLYRPCGFALNDQDCKEPVINFSEDTRCVYHTILPPLAPLNEPIARSCSPLISVDDENGIDVDQISADHESIR